MFVIAVTYIVKPGHEVEAEGYLAELTAATRKEPGCRMYVAHRAKDDPRKFFIYEQYDDEAALERHRASAHFERFGKNGLQTIAESRDPQYYLPI
ncbi:MAG TPA: putative quinol monooxygenase [Candidatus Baltobacteraceae bacterium]|nr:putative quinol monooxygenase [Candidatus Baltobacteraceae bacterium]